MLDVCRLVLGVSKAYINATPGQESDASLRIGRLVFAEEFELVVFIFIVANVAVTRSALTK